MKKLTRTISVAALVATIAGCAPIPSKIEDATTVDISNKRQLGLKPYELVMPASIQMRRVTDVEKRRRISINRPKGKLISILREAFGTNIQIVTEDPAVDLTMQTSVYAMNTTVDDFLYSLIGQTGYDISYNGNRINISSVAEREWYMTSIAGDASMSSTVGQSVLSQSGSTESSSSGATDATGSTATVAGTDSSGSSGSSPSVTTYSEDGDVWEKTIEDALTLVKHGIPKGVPEPVVIGMRTLGTIRAVGWPPAIARLDRYMKDIERDLSTQITLDVKIFEVTLKDDKSQGIDWSAVIKGISNVSLAVGTNGLGLLSGLAGHAFDLNLKTSGEDLDTELMVRMLNQYGNTTLLNQPRVTAANGRPAYVSSGEESSFIGSVQQGQDQNGNIVVTPSLQTVKLGVSLSITPRYTKDGRVAITVVPVLSSLSGETSFSFNGIDFSTPNISLNELATTAYVRPGESLHLGGMISKRLRTAINRLPFMEENKSALVNNLMGSYADEIERRELYIVIRPTVHNG